MSEHEAAVKRDPRVDPRAGDVVRMPDGEQYRVTHADELILFRVWTPAFQEEVDFDYARTPLVWRSVCAAATIIHAEGE